MLDHGLPPLAIGLRLATTTLIAELAGADVRASAVNGAKNVVVLALRGAHVAGVPLTVGITDHPCVAVFATLRNGDDGLLAVHFGLADEDETTGSEIAGVADASYLLLVLLGASLENELDATDSVKMNDTIPSSFILLASTVGQLVLGLEHCGDGCDDLFLVWLDRNER